MGGPYSHLQVEAALCVWEYLNDVTLLDPSRQDPQWVALRDAVGSVELRHASIEIGTWALKVHDVCTKHDPSFFDGLAYDWEIIPAIVDRCRDEDGLPVIAADAFPPVEATASLVALWASLEDYRSHVQVAVNKTEVGYIRFLADHADDIEREFANGVEPEAFVARLVALRSVEEALGG